MASNIQSIKTIAGGKSIAGKLANVKSATDYQIIVGDGFVFNQSEGKILAPKDSASKNNFNIVTGTLVDFTPNTTTYFGILPSGNQRMSKGEVDAFQATEAAKIINSAADSAVKSETIKSKNINKTALYVTGIVLLIGFTFGIVYKVRKNKKAAAAGNGGAAV